MAKRVGKYKISQRDSAVSLLDGGVVVGNLNISSLVGSSANPGVAGQLFATGSVNLAGADLGATTGSAFLVLASQG